jgi:hypothetical protein
MYKGYLYLAAPIVDLMKESEQFTRAIYFFAKPWAEEMAYQVGAAEKGNLAGKLIMSVGMVICGIAGVVVGLPYSVILALNLLFVVLLVCMIRQTYKNKFKYQMI